MTRTESDALQIGLFSLLALVLFLILPEPIADKGPAAELLPLANYFVIACGIGGIVYSAYLFLRG